MIPQVKIHRHHILFIIVLTIILISIALKVWGVV